MHSIRTKLTILTVCAVMISMSIATVLSAIAINDYGDDTSNQILYLLCETGEKNLDAYFESVERSVETVSGYAKSDLENIPIGQLGQHLNRVRDVFSNMANNTAGITTYYYRIDPTVPTSEKGFWYVNLEGNGFSEHKVTDITLYDTDDQTSLVWFTVPKATGSAIWLPPYNTENLDVYVLSYNVPIYKDDLFIGVIGIEIDYKTIVAPVDHITLYENGYAFINDAEGNIIYHPRMDMETLTGPEKPTVPDGMLNEDTFFRYTYEGVKKQAVWMPLSNGMRLNVSVPISEINGGLHSLIAGIVIVSVVLLLLFTMLTLRLAGRVTNPLRKLTEAAVQMDAGNYDVKLNYKGNDEVGILTRTFNLLISHLKIYISDLNDLAYADALTSVHNKGAFDIYMRKIQKRVRSKDPELAFAVGFFDCDDLKSINDQYGHDKGDLYLKNACATICQVFLHSPVFRMGGDEFAVILQNEDYENRTELVCRFAEKNAERGASAEFPWEKVQVSMGLAVYDPHTDRAAEDVVRRADRLMYQNKRQQKAARHE